MDEQFTARICFIAMQAKKSGYEDVAAWMQRHLTQDIHAERTRKNRTRGVKVRLAPRGGGNGPVAILDAARVRELMDEAL